MYDQDAIPGDVAIFAGNLGPTLLDLGIGCIPFGGGLMALNPGDPIFLPTLTALGTKPFVPVPPPNFPSLSFNDVAATSNQLDVGPACGLVGLGGLGLDWQAWRIRGSVVVDQTQVLRMTLRATSGHPL